MEADQLTLETLLRMYRYVLRTRAGIIPQRIGFVGGDVGILILAPVIWDVEYGYRHRGILPSRRDWRH